MQQGSSLVDVLERSVGSASMGQVTTDLPGSESGYNWQRPKDSGGGTGNYIEVSIGSETTPQGTEFVLIRDSSNPGTVLAFRKNRFRQFAQGIQNNQYTIT